MPAAGAYRGIRRIVLNNLIYIGNIRALSTLAKRTGTAWLQPMVDDVSAVGGFDL
jgi:hypothetical protein